MSTMTSKGQVTIPKAFRDHLGLKPGSNVEFEIDDRGAVVLKAETELKSRRDRLERFRGHAGPGLSTDELMQLLRGDDP